MKDITVTVKLTSDQGEHRYYTIQKLRNTENVTVWPAMHNRIQQDIEHIGSIGAHERITKVVGNKITEKQVAEINNQARPTLVIKI